VRTQNQAAEFDRKPGDMKEIAEFPNGIKMDNVSLYTRHYTMHNAIGWGVKILLYYFIYQFY
jgi:hypothetical protein